MRALRMLSGSLLWIVSGLLVLLGVLLSVTVILAPLGIPLFLVGKKLMGVSVRLFLPRAAAHPVKTGRKSATEAAGSLRDGAESLVRGVWGHKGGKGAWKKVKGAVACRIIRPPRARLWSARLLAERRSAA